MLTCRRVRRSSVPSLALELLLDAERERNQAAAVALGTLDGQPLAGVGDIPIMRVTQAAACKLRGDVDDASVAALGNERFQMSVIDLPEGVPVLLTSLGTSTMSREVEAGIVRILA